MLVVVSPYDTNHLTDKSFIVIMKRGRTYSDNTVNREFVFEMLSQLFCEEMQWNKKIVKYKAMPKPKHHYHYLPSKKAR